VVDNDNKVASLSLEAIANQRRFEGAYGELTAAFVGNAQLHRDAHLSQSTCFALF
jgi:hypothetical protein